MNYELSVAAIKDAYIYPCEGQIVFADGKTAELNNVIANRLLLLFRERYDEVDTIEDLNALLLSGVDFHYSIDNAGFLSYLDLSDSCVPISFDEWEDDYIPEIEEYEDEPMVYSGSLSVDCC